MKTQLFELLIIFCLHLTYNLKHFDFIKCSNQTTLLSQSYLTSLYNDSLHNYSDDNWISQRREWIFRQTKSWLERKLEHANFRMGILDLSTTGRQQSRLFKKREGTRESGMPGEVGSGRAMDSTKVL